MNKLETGLHYPLKLDVLPSGWRVGHVGDFAEVIQPGFASGKHNKEGAGIPHIRPYNIDRQGKLDLTEIKSVAPDSDAKRLRTDDVLFNNTNSPELIGKTAVIASAGDWGFSNHMTRIRFKEDVAPKFAAYQLHFLWMTGYYLHNCVKHVNQASISSKTLANAVPFIAPPLDQQKRIVAEIEKQFSRLDEAVANLKRVKANLKRYKAAVLKAAVEGRLVETEAELARREGRSYETGEQLLQRILETRRSQWKGKGKYKEPAAADTTDLPELPEGWVSASIGQLSLFSFYGPRFSSEDYATTGPYVLRTTDISESGRVDTTVAPRIALSAEDFAKYRVERGDLLVTRTGSLGTLALFDDEVDAIPGAYLIQFRLSLDWITRCYLFLCLKSSRGQAHLTGGGAGVGRPNINAPKIEAFTLGLPPVAEQRRIVAEVDRRLSLLRETEAQVDASLQRAERLKQSILARAFSSQMVCQDGYPEAA